MVDNRVVAGYHAGRLPPEKVAPAVEALLKLYEEGKVKPEVHQVFSLEEVRKPLFVIKRMFLNLSKSHFNGKAFVQKDW